MPTSRIPGFYRLNPTERRGAIEGLAELDTGEVHALAATALSLESADLMIENVIGTFGLPLAVGVNFLVNAKDVVVPMVVEEPSVVAAVYALLLTMFIYGEVKVKDLPKILRETIEASVRVLFIIAAAAVGLWPDPNPNPIGPGLLFFLSFWPAVICIIIGIVRVRLHNRKRAA